MTSKKDQRRARRRAEKRMEQAWREIEGGRPDRAERASRHAVEGGGVNPRLWNERGQILELCGRDDEAEQAFRTALALAPTYAEVFANLARLQARRGKMAAAERLQRRAVELEDTPEARRALDHYASLLPRAGAEDPGDATAPRAAPPTARTGRFDWAVVAAELTSRGVAVLRRLLDGRECEVLRRTWEDPARFEHEIVRDDEESRVACRYLQPPLPPLVQELLAEVYARAAPIANGWNELLGRPDRFPAAHDDLLRRCRGRGQHRSPVCLLRFPEGGFEGLHRDGRGLAFPLELRVNLGGEAAFRLVDRRPGRKLHGTAVPTAPGDGVLFCGRERLVWIAGVHGLQPVLHGSPEGPARFALAAPFHLVG